MSQCCNTQLYISDSHCPECGIEVETPPTLQSVFTLDTTIGESYQGLGQSFTGRVIDTYYYTRSNGDLSSGYLWITLLTDKNEQKKFSVQGESETFQNIKVGDVLSIVASEEITQHHSTSRSDRKIVTHNSSPAIIVLHKEDNSNVSSVESCLEVAGEASPSAPSCWIAAIISLGIIWMMYNSWGVEPTSYWFMGACAFPIICILLARSATKTDKANQILVDQVEEARQKVMNIYYSALGYERYARPTSPLDTICSACDKAINHLSVFCCHCGEAQIKQCATEQLATPISQINANHAAETTVISVAEKEQNGETSVVNNVVNINTPTQTVREHNAAIFAEYGMQEQYEYIHKHTLSANKAHQTNTACRLVRVLDKHMGVNVNQGVQETTYTTEYKNRYGTVVDSKDETTYRAYRDVYLEGFLIIEDKDGNINKFSSNAAILKLTNIGDLILIGESTITRAEKTEHFLEYVYNINKDEKISGFSSLSIYYPSFPILSILNVFLFPVLLFMLCLGLVSVSDNHIIAKLAALGIAAIGTIYYTLFPIIMAATNSGNKKRLLPNLLKKLNECRKNRETLLDNIK